MTTGTSTTFTAKFYQADGVTEDTTITPVWTLDVPSTISSVVSITEQSGNTITISVGSKATVGTSFALNLTDDSGQYHATKTITIKSWF